MSSNETFKKLIWDYYHKNKRDLPWRTNITPYNIVISEVMLQQTQVPRIISKYNEFIQELPSFEALAQANFQQVLKLWQGIGYNRRAIYLQQIAKIIVEKYDGNLPDDPIILDSFPGIGAATAASIVVYAYNKPIPFIETNIRRIYIHHFFADKQDIHDEDIMPIVEETIDNQNPREWYYALMDYGTMLAKLVDNPNKRSKHYVKQSKFEGSNRQIRGKILKELLIGPQTTKNIFKVLDDNPLRVENIISELEMEGFLVRDKDLIKVK